MPTQLDDTHDWGKCAPLFIAEVTKDLAVIVCSMERDGSNKITYEAGAIEELNLNQSVVNILEGTKPTFENRRRKYI